MSLTFNIQITKLPQAGDATELVEGGKVAVRWLGQAGFSIHCGDLYLLIDPYLSDFLAKKYKGKEFPHIRMIPAPVKADKIRNLDWILCTHRHSDHMDPEALLLLLKNNPPCKIIAPRAEKEHLLQLGLNKNQIQFVNAGESTELSSGANLEVIASAHEELKINEREEHHFLGYVIHFGDVTIYHSGDCVPYPSLQKALNDKNIDIALLPINGRDEFRASRGVLGNFTFDEAVQLCESSGIDNMIAHHFGMFEFNTIDIEQVQNKIANLRTNVQIVLPNVEEVYLFSKQQGD